MRKLLSTFIFLLIFHLASRVSSQETDALTHKQRGIEGVLVETYMLHPGDKTSDATDGKLPEDYVTYRIFLDMAPGYKLQIIYGLPDRPLRINTTTTFYNNQDYGAKSGCDINNVYLNSYGVAFDSWLSMGAATIAHLGIPKEDDYDGSVLEYASMKKSDGLIAGFSPIIHYYNFQPYFFQWKDSSSLVINDGAWSVYEGVSGPTKDNRVLIAQLTTDGLLSLSLNVQLLTPDGDFEQYVYENAIGKEILSEGLKINPFKNNTYDIKYLTNSVPD